MPSPTTNFETGFLSSSALKEPVALATTGNIALSGLPTIDGSSTEDGLRVLAMAQSVGSENGIYVASAGVWQRAPDFDNNTDVVKGTRVFVTDGTENGGKEFYVATENPVVLGSSDIQFLPTISDENAFEGLAGGTDGQVLTKQSGADFDYAWETPSGGGGGAVNSVNGQTGIVVLDAADVGARSDTYVPAFADITSKPTTLSGYGITDGQPLDSDLTAVAGLSTTGLITRTASGTAAARTLTGPAAGITVSNGNGVSGNPTLALANDLAAVEAISTTGYVKRTGSETWSTVATVPFSDLSSTPTTLSGYGITDAQPIDADLTAVGGLTGTGFAKRTGSNTWSLSASIDLTSEVTGDLPFANIAQIATARIVGRTTASTGDIEALTGTQATALLDTFTTGAKGLAPSSPGGTSAFLRADGSWATPPGGGGGGGDMFASVYDPQAIADDAFDRANHTGTQTASTISDFSTAADARISAAVGVSVQGYDAQLADIAALAITDGNIIVGNGTNWVAESGDTARTSIGVGTGDSPQFTAVNLGHATDTTLTRVSAGVVAIEGSNILTAATGQPLDADLTALAGLASTAGMLSRTGAGAFAVRTLTAPAAGITISNGTGASGNPTLALANDLSAVEGLASNGIAARTATDTWAVRTITAGTGVSVTNGDGVSGNPTVGLASTHNAASKQTIAIPAGAMVPRVTSGAGSTTYDSGSNDITVPALAFDTTTQEYAQFAVPMPKGWDESTVTFIPYWTNTGGASTETVAWTLAGAAISNDDTLNATMGTAQTSSDTWLAQNDLHIGPESSAITIGGTPAENDMVVFQISRDVANDNMAGDALLLGIKLLITYSAANDA